MRTQDGSRPRASAVARRAALALAILAAMIVVPSAVSFGAPAKPISVVDYAQCANGMPPSEAVTCTDGWLNGILQASNSHFHEGDVTPQRLLAFMNTSSDATCSGTTITGCHSVTLSYQARKGSTHAYDSLATWNHTVTDADRCQGLTTAVQDAIGCDGDALDDVPDDVLAIGEDPTIVEPFTAASGATNAHDLGGQALEIYNGDLIAMTAPEHDTPNCGPSKCFDDYATVTIYYAADAGDTIQLLFGGHLAVSPTDRGGWGEGLGAANINGGPYHIKWTAADGDSVGNRDNQIMGSSILPLAQPAISTDAGAAGSGAETATIGTAVVLTDTVILGGSNDPVGATSFQLHGPFTPGSTPTCDSSTAVTGVGGSITTYTKTGGGTGVGTWSGTYTASSYTFTAAGEYYWVASFAGDVRNAAAGPHGCGVALEKVTVSRATASGTTVMRLGDAVTVTGVTPSGTVDFRLYKDDATCSVAANLVYSELGVALSSASASTASEYSVPTSAGGVYRWLVTYSGDRSNAPGTVSNCVEVATIAYPT
jgi:hypothetical protein